MIVKLTLIERLLHRLHALPTPMMDAFGGIIFGRALTIAVRKGLFEIVEAQPMGHEELAAQVGLDSRAVELMMDMFVAGGYVKRKKGKYAIGAEGKKWLVRSSPFYLGNLIRYFESLYERWTHLEVSVERGRPQRPYFADFNDTDWEVYVYGMSDLARLLLPEVRKLITLPHGPSSVLDIGGSHGLYAMDCCRRNHVLHVVVMDFDAALRHTSRIVEAQGLSERVTLTGGNFLEQEFPPQQDCVLMFNIIHGLRQEENRRLVERALDALKPEGRLYILDQLRDHRGRRGLSTLVPLFVGLNLLNETGGTAYAEEQVRDWCSTATTVRVFKLRMPGVGLVEAIK